MESKPPLGAADSFYFCLFAARKAFTGKTLLVSEIYDNNPLLVFNQYGDSSSNVSLVGRSALFDFAFTYRWNCILLPNTVII